MRNYIILNGKNSNEINGLLIQELPPISKPLIRTEVEEIDGRDGDIVTPLGYSAYDKEFTIGLYKDFDVNEVAAYFNSEGTVIFSNEPDKYYYYQITAQIDFERLVRYRTATVTMHCQPFKYSATEQPITEDVSGTVSDEGTNLALENTAEAPFNTLDLKGNTSQQTYTGKNKLNYYANYQVGYSTTINGVTYTMLPDGGIRMQGKNNTSSNSSFTVVGSGWDGTTIQVPLDGSATYMSSITRPSNAYRWYIRGIGSGGSVITLNSNNDTVLISGCSGITYVMLQVVPNAEVNGVVYPMVEIGNQATSFEPYVGGTASPNPDYPQAVQTVTGENVVKICKKNLFDVSAIPYVAKRAYGADGTELIWNNYSGIDGYQQVAPNTTYTITKGASGSVSYLCEYDKNKAFIQRKTDQRTFTTTANTHYLRWSVYSQGDVAPTQTQLELGSTATAYEPYQGQSYEVNLGKNLLDPSILEVGNITAQGVDSASTQVVRSDYIYLKAGNYVLRVNDANNQIKIFRYVIYDTSKTFVLSSSPVAKQTTITMSADGYLRLCFYNDPWRDITLDEIVASNIQLELGSQATSYAAYFAPIELCNIPGTDYRDRFIPRDGKWYVHKEVGKAVLDGSESWYNAGGNAPYGLVIDDGLITTDNDTPPLVYCDKFYPVSQNASWSAYDSLISTNSTSTSTKTIRIRYTSVASLSAFQTWLGLNNTILYYALATPTDTEITNEALIEQLDNIYYHAHAYKGRTHITSSAATGNVPHIIAAEVGEDNESTITNAGNYLSKPKITVYGSGDISLYINDMHVLQITLGDEGYITIDTAQMEAYKDTLDNLKNRLVIGDYSNARLKPGANKIHFTGTVTKYVVENYSRWL